MAGWHQVAGARGLGWGLGEPLRWRYLCWLPLVVRTRPKWQCVALGAAGGTAALLALLATMGG